MSRAKTAPQLDLQIFLTHLSLLALGVLLGNSPKTLSASLKKLLFNHKGEFFFKVLSDEFFLAEKRQQILTKFCAL